MSLPSDRSFWTFESAVAHVTGPPLPDDTTLPWNQALFDVLYEYSITIRRSPSFRSTPSWPAWASAS